MFGWGFDMHVGLNKMGHRFLGEMGCRSSLGLLRQRREYAENVHSIVTHACPRPFSLLHTLIVP